MSLRLYDTATREVRPFEPINPGSVGIYLCGATPQGAPHIGHMRSAIAVDILVRWLHRHDQEVTLVRNVTDIEDKILAKSAEAGVPWWQWAYRFEQEFSWAYAALGVLPVSYEPRATGHITEMVELIELLIDRGHAYTGDEGNVYFDVRSFGKYGELTKQLLENMSTEDSASDKRDPHDFALWKKPKEGEPETASWPAPFGRGRPGWHLECSAMARKYLGEAFDIHAGGLDLRFPHHENEQAQSWAAGWEFTSLWMHNAWVTVGGEKMSKSLDNSLTVPAVLERSSPVVLRYALGAVHYRSALEFSDATLADSAAAWERITGFLTRAAELAPDLPGLDVDAVQLPAAFVAAMDDDLNVPAALAVVHEHVRSGNTVLADDGDAGQVAAQVRAMLSVFGLDPYAEPWAGSNSGEQATSRALEVLVDEVLTARTRARQAKDFTRADELRDLLASAGITVADSPAGARWSLQGGN